MNEYHFDFEAFLLLASVITGVLWAVGLATRKKDTQRNRISQGVINFGVSFFPVFIFVLLVRTFVFEPFRIPSSSMMPNLLTGDFIYVNKYSYGLKMPFFHNTLIEVGHPQRGDVVVFRNPVNQAEDYIKRVVGLPGDRIHYDVRSKTVFVNGEAMPQKTLGNYTGLIDNRGDEQSILKEEYFDGEAHEIMTKNGHLNVSADMRYLDLVVPEGEYFMMGDNRDNSRDSRFFGPVPERNLVGRAVFIWMHWRMPGFTDGLKRIGNKIK